MTYKSGNFDFIRVSLVVEEISLCRHAELVSASQQWEFTIKETQTNRASRQ